MNIMIYGIYCVATRKKCVCVYIFSCSFMITGANSGIGKVIALTLAKKGKKEEGEEE